MSRLENCTISCGVTQLYDLNKYSCLHMKTLGCSMGGLIIFSDTKRSGTGERFGKYLQNQGYKVTKSPWSTNATSRNLIRVYVWNTVKPVKR